MFKRMSDHLVFVINLKRRPDRLEIIKQALPEPWKSKALFTTEWEGIVDGERIENEQDMLKAGVKLYPNWKIDGHTNTFWNRNIKKGEIGCSFSHLNVWRKSFDEMEKDESIKFVVILEDDATFSKDACERTLRCIESLPQTGVNGWDILYLGCVLQQGKTNTPFNSWCNRPGFSYCTYGYVLSRTGVKKVLQQHLENNMIAVDEFIPALYVEHPREDVRKLYKPCLNAFVIKPHTVFQRTKLEAGSNTEQSEQISF